MAVAMGLKEVEFLALGLGPLCVEKGDGDDDELCGHPEAEEVEEGLEDGPAGHAEETPCARGQDERVPGGDGERADKEVLVRAQVRRQVELVGEIEGGHDTVSQSSLGSYIRRVPISPLLLSPWTPPRPSPATSTLVTFLATLFLLLFVSAAIVLRSFLLRRRYHQRLDAAFAAGLFLAPRAQGSRRRRFGHRPALRSAWIAPGGPSWASTTVSTLSFPPSHQLTPQQPLAAQPVFVKRRIRSRAPASDPAPAPTPTTPLSRLAARMLEPSPAFAPEPAPAPAPAFKIRVEMLQVAVLIAMPTLRRSPKEIDDDDDDDDDERLPELVMGVTRVGYHPTPRARDAKRPSVSDSPAPVAPPTSPIIEEHDEEEEEEVDPDGVEVVPEVEEAAEAAARHRPAERHDAPPARRVRRPRLSPGAYHTTRAHTHPIPLVCNAACTIRTLLVLL